MKKIVFASGNPKKTAEIQRMAPEWLEIVCLKDVPRAAGIPEPEENENTFLGNARLKAAYWSFALNMPVIAEDSGLQIEALNGYPGVRTKRCIQDLCPESNVNADKPEELYPLLLELMQRSGNPSTKAWWVSAIAFADIDGSVACVEEKLEGEMCKAAGLREFGFDQYFKPYGQSKTLSELTPEEKDEIGPRKKAFERVINFV